MSIILPVYIVLIRGGAADSAAKNDNVILKSGRFLDTFAPV